MAKCFDVVGYKEPCNVVRKKYTGRALLIYGTSGGESFGITFSENGIKANLIFGDSTNFQDFIINWKSILPVFIDAENPFPVTIQGNTDSGRVMYTKTIPVSIPATRDGKAEEFIMGLQKGLYGSAIIVLESFGLYEVSGIVDNDIFGSYSPVRIDPTSVTRSEYENGGAWTFNLVCEEPIPNVICNTPGLELALNSLEA